MRKFVKKKKIQLKNCCVMKKKERYYQGFIQLNFTVIPTQGKRPNAYNNLQSFLL